MASSSVELGQKELQTAQYQAFSKLAKPYAVIFTIAIIGNIIVYYPKVDSFFSLYLQLFLILVAACRALHWQWLDANEDRLKSKTSQILNIECATWIFGAAIISAMDIYFYVHTDDFGQFYTIVAQGLLGLLAFQILHYMKRTAIVVGAILFIPLATLQFSQGSLPHAMVGVVILTVFAGMIAFSSYYMQDFKELLASKFRVEALGKENARLASIDLLTELPNRRFFFEALSQRYKSLSGDSGVLIAGVVDLDGFKPVNDTYGHRVGDQVLHETAQRLAKASDNVVDMSRIGGDEFGFIVSGTTDDVALEEIGRCLIKALDVPVEIGALLVNVGCSVGIARYELKEQDEKFDPHQLYENADFALYHAKKTGKSRAVIFSKEHRDMQIVSRQLAQALRAPNLEDELYPVFQPMVDIATGETRTFEALARWQSSTLGFIPPGQFIAVAEQNGYMHRITTILFRKCLQQMKNWPQELDLSFNLSSHDLCSPETIDVILELLDMTSVDPSRIYFEVTETAVIHDFDLAMSHIDELKRQGANIALDDFGTGLSSLAYVNRMPLDKLKIDREFVNNIETDPSSRNIVRSIISLCTELGLECVVEGAESQGQVNTLASLGCKTIQGYFYSKPIKSDEIAPFLLKNVAKTTVADHSQLDKVAS